MKTATSLRSNELRSALSEERESRVVLKNYRKDGTLFWNELYVSPVHDEEGRLTNFVGVQNDITERRRIEEVLRESEERFRATFEHAAIGAAQVGIDGRWLRVNRRLCEIVGYEPEEMLQTTFQEITHPDDLEGDLAQVRRLLADELGTYTMEKRYLRKDGSIVWVNLTVSLVRDASGEPAYFIAVVEDISERKKTEEERDLLLVKEQLARSEAVEARRRLALLAAAGPALSASLDYDRDPGEDHSPSRARTRGLVPARRRRGRREHQPARRRARGSREGGPPDEVGGAQAVR